MRSISSTELFQVLDQAAPLLQDRRTKAQEYALKAFMAGTFLRADSDRTFERYFPYLKRFIEEGDRSLRPFALYVLTNARVPLLPTIMNYLHTQLTRPDYSGPERGQIVAGLMTGRSQEITDEIVQFARSSSDEVTISNILLSLGNARTTNKSALDFIGTCLAPDKIALHASAISAIIRMLPAQRSRYYAELSRLATEAWGGRASSRVGWGYSFC